MTAVDAAHMHIAQRRNLDPVRFVTVLSCIVAQFGIPSVPEFGIPSEEWAGRVSEQREKSLVEGPWASAVTSVLVRCRLLIGTAPLLTVAVAGGASTAFAASSLSALETHC